MTVSVNGTTGITFNDASIQNTAATGFGFKNRLINGQMVIDQRNAGASVATTTTGAITYTLDRWGYQVTQASKFTVQQNAGSVTPPAGFKNYLGVTSTSAYSVTSSDYFSVQQKIEGFNMADLNWGTANAQSVTLSFWVRSSLSGTFGGSFINADYTRSYPFTYTISAANTWEQKSITIAGDTTGTWVSTNGVGIQIWFGLGMGSSNSGTAGAWTGSSVLSASGATSVVGTSGATFYITGVQLEKGSTATSFDYRPYGTELNLCLRYYWKDTGVSIQGIAQANTYDGFDQVYFPVPMRVAPTATNLTGGNTFARNVSGSPTVGGATGLAVNTWTTHVEYRTQAAGGSGNSGTAIIVYESGTATASAEL